MKKLKSIICLAVIFICSSVLLTACGNTVKFKVKFMVDNEEYAVVDTTGNETISMPENPAKENYIFDGWYWDENVWQNPFTANSLLEQPLNSDMKVYAKWHAIEKLKGTQANFDGFEQVDESMYKISVANVTEIFDLSDYVDVAADCTWTLATDLQAINIIPSKIATLNVGDNIYYVLVTTPSSRVKLYTLNIRRRPIYNVSIWLGDIIMNEDSYECSVISPWTLTQQVEEDGYAKQPEDSPRRPGYHFNGCWNFDFTTKITHDTRIDASGSWVIDIEADEHLQYQLAGTNSNIYYAIVGCLDNTDNIVIPESFNGLPVKSIRSDAFSRCETVNSVFIPQSISFVDNYAFGGSITEVYCEFAYPYDTIQCDDVQISIDGSGILIPMSYTPSGILLGGAFVIQMPYCRWQNGWQDECNAQILWYGRDWKYVSGIPTANTVLSEQQGWLAYKVKVDYYNRMAAGKLQQLGNLLALWNNAQTIEDKYEYLQTNSYNGNFEELETEITMNWNSLVSCYNSVVKNQKPTNNYADPQFTMSIYKPIIEFNITNQEAEQLTVAEINGAMVNNCLNSGKVTVNLLIDSEGIVNETVAAYRLIDWSVYGLAYQNDVMLTNVADIYLDNTNLNYLAYINLAPDVNLPWDGQGGIRYFLTYQTNSNNSFYEHSQIENFVLKENSYFSRKGVCIDGEIIYYYYEGTTLINL